MSAWAGQVLGQWFFIAVGVQALSVFFEQAGAARSPDEDASRVVSRLLILLSLATPCVLATHAYFSAPSDELRVTALATPIVATVGGALLGAIFGALAHGAAHIMRRIALPLAFVSFAIAMVAAWPTAQLLASVAL